jgi:hypothetical protein
MREAIKQYITDFSAAIRNDDTAVDEFRPCVDLDYNKEQCEGCKLYEICGLIAEDNNG